MLGSAAGYRNEDEKSTCLSEVGRSFFTLGNAFTRLLLQLLGPVYQPTRS